MVGDICDPLITQSILTQYPQINFIYHLAGIASPIYYQHYPLETLNVGYIGTQQVLELCRHYPHCRMLFTSTSEVYGHAKEHPQKETYYGNVNTFGIRSCYDESKRVAESLIHTYTELYSLETRVVRIFNTYATAYESG